MRTRRHWLSGERALLLTGGGGIALALFLTCGGTSGTPVGDGNAGATGVAGSVGAAGATTTGLGGDSTTGTAGNSGAGGTSVAASCTSDAATVQNTAAVVTAANTLLASLTSAQQTAIQYQRTLASAEQWSNLPTTAVQRNGVRIGDMSADAQAAAVALASVAAGSTGGTLFSELRAADEFLVTDGGAPSTDYGLGLYYFSIHGTPSTTADWMLQIAGHHLAYNFTYNGKCTSATPLFDGVEPTTWTDANGVAHAPLEAQRASLVALLTSVSPNPDALLAGTFSDLVNGPVGGAGPGAASSGGDTKYPSSLVYPTGTTGRGVTVSALSADQVALVKTAMEAWVKNVADPVAAALLAQYESADALAQTYVAYAGSPDLTTQTSYGRIDGPRVWIEFTVQGGIIYRDRVHYHTIWRDKVSDYGADFVSP